MKTLFILLLIISAGSLHAQHKNIKEGRWAMNGVTITRAGDMEIVDSMGVKDTCYVQWTGAKTYNVTGKDGTVFVRIDSFGEWGFKAKVVGNKRKGWIEAKTIN